MNSKALCVEIKNSDTTPLNVLLRAHYRKQTKNFSTLPSLLDSVEVAVNVRENQCGCAALHFAVLLNKVDIINAIAANKFFNPNVQTLDPDEDEFVIEGDTALHLAIRMKDEALISAILKLPGINTDIKNSLGNNALVEAEKNKVPSIISLVRSHTRTHDNKITEQSYDPFIWASSLDLSFQSKSKQKPYKKVIVEGNIFCNKWQIVDVKTNQVLRALAQIVKQIELLSEDYYLDALLISYVKQAGSEIVQQYQAKGDTADIREILEKYKTVIIKAINNYLERKPLPKNFETLKSIVAQQFDLVLQSNNNYLVANLSFIVSDREHSKDGPHSYKVIHYPIQVKEYIYHDKDKSHVQYNEDMGDASKREFDQHYLQCVLERYDAMNQGASKHNVAISKQQTLATATTLTKGLMAENSFIHNETNLFYYLEQPTTLEEIVNFLSRNGLLPGAKVYALVLDVFSNGYICDPCRIQTLGLQNSHSNGFLKNFSDYLLERNYQIPREAHGIRMLTRVSTEKKDPNPHYTTQDQFDLKALGSMKILAGNPLLKLRTPYTYFMAEPKKAGEKQNHKNCCVLPVVPLSTAASKP